MLKSALKVREVLYDSDHVKCPQYIDSFLGLVQHVDREGSKLITLSILCALQTEPPAWREVLVGMKHRF